MAKRFTQVKLDAFKEIQVEAGVIVTDFNPANPVLDDRRLYYRVYLHTAAFLNTLYIAKTARSGGFFIARELSRQCIFGFASRRKYLFFRRGWYRRPSSAFRQIRCFQQGSSAAPSRL